MKPSEKTQIAAVTSKVQAEAITRVSKQRGISKQALIREGIEAVTGVASGIATYPPGGQRGFSNPNHPFYRNRTARKRAHARTQAEGDAQGAARRLLDKPTKEPAG